MNETNMPYDKAIEETAKTTGRVLDIVQSMTPAVADAYGFLIGDRISAARERQLDKLSRETKKILYDRNVEETQPLPEQIAIPLLEAAQGETRSELQDVFATMLANAMDPKFASNVRAEFIDTLRKLHPLEVRILQFAFKRYQTTDRRFDIPSLHEALKTRATAIELSIEHLSELNCIKKDSSPLGKLTSYGFELMLACAKEPPADNK